MRIVAAVVLAVLAVAPSAAKSASVEAVFREAGLFGSWAPNCQEAPSPDNPHVAISRPERDIVLEQHDLGPDYAPNRYVILSARREKGDRLAVEALFQQGDSAPQRQRLMFLIRDHTRRTMYTDTAGETPRVKDGIAVAIGKPTPLLRKCE